MYAFLDADTVGYPDIVYLIFNLIYSHNNRNLNVQSPFCCTNSFIHCGMPVQENMEKHMLTDRGLESQSDINLQSVSKRMVQSENNFYKYEICFKSMCIWYHIKAE